MPALRLASLMVVWGVAHPAILAAQTLPTPRAAYESACAACHGLDGRGRPRDVVGFDVPLPDFTDCSFASREPDADWLAVSHDGGPARAFDRRMPAFGEALSRDELQNVLAHVRAFCADRRWPRGELNLPRPLVTEKAFPEDETVFTTAVAATGSGEVVNELLYERRIGPLTQFEIVVPFVSHESATAWRHGPGDVAVALKRVLTHGLGSGHIVSVSGEAVFPTGDEASGLGGGVGVFETFLTYGQLLPANGFVQAQAGVEIPTTGEKEGFWRVALGRTFEQANFGRAWSPIVELLAARELEAGGITHWDAVPQMQVSLSKRQHILVSAGVSVPINDRPGRSTRVIAYLLWDWFDGGLLDGWR